MAELAQVSQSTVSRTFTPGANVNAATRERILEAARQVGYRTGSSRTVRRTVTVGLVMGDLDNPFYHTVLTLFLNRLHERGIRALCRTAVALDRSEEEVRTMLRHGVDALLIACAGIKSSATTASCHAGVPVVLFNRTVPGAKVSSVQTDNLTAGRTVADFLARGGHKRMAFINGLEGTSTNEDRRAGFVARLSELHLPPPLEEFGEYTHDGGREAVKRLMLGAQQPDAIFCANDISAFGVLDGLRADLDLSVPRDVSVVGFDDVPMADWPAFNLTTVRQRRNQMVLAAITLLERLLEDNHAKPETVRVDGRLIVRGSARLPQAGAR